MSLLHDIRLLWADAHAWWRTQKLVTGRQHCIFRCLLLLLFSVGRKTDKVRPSPLQAFQKLIYVSYQVFGAQKASFLLPFARTLGINPGGIDIANREVAKQLFQNFLVAAGGELPVSPAACQALTVLIA